MNIALKTLLSRLLDWLAGCHPAVRRHSLFALSTGQFYAVSVGVTYHAASLGVVTWPVAHGLGAATALLYFGFYALVRSGWSQRFADPVLTLPHAMLSEALTIVAYVLIGAARGDVVVLMGQTIVVSMFRLKPRATLCLGLWTTGWLLAAQLGLLYWQAPGFSGVRAMGHMLVSASGLLAMTLVGMWICEIRVRIARQSQKLRATLTQAEVLATTDMLTGLLNRRRMGEYLAEELVQASRLGHPVCLALIDIDHFKRINDTHGHRVGDEVLRAFAALAQGEMREVDKLARWGGEEFLVLMPHVNQTQAQVAIERLCQRVAGQPMGEQGQLTVTVSVGLAPWWPGESMACWLDRTDKALYEAKHQGRNRCVVANVDGPSEGKAPAVVAPEPRPNTLPVVS